MNIVRYRRRELPEPLIGIRSGDEVAALSGVASLHELWALPAAQLRDRLSGVGASIALGDVELLAPVDGRTEVWACGVTYQTSRQARIEESEKAADVYALVYEAERPEVFFKSVAWRVSGPQQQLGIRGDSTVDVPEPELALVINRFGEIVGYTICNDMSSRSIEGENPLTRWRRTSSATAHQSPSPTSSGTNSISWPRRGRPGCSDDHGWGRPRRAG